MDSQTQQQQRRKAQPKSFRRTFAVPGSPAKLKTLEERARLGLPLHHEKDGPVRDLN